MQECGLECWFKGGTSLSKGFGLIRRFSEDLDLKLEPGTAKDVPRVANRRSDGKRHAEARRVFFESVARTLRIPGAAVELVRADDLWRSAELRIAFPSAVGEPMPPPMKPFVVIEAGSARVNPSVERDLSSFVHEALAKRGISREFADNRPCGVACAHPLVTLVEKLEAISKRFERTTTSAASFVRHYEDAARVIEAAGALPPLKGGPGALIADMVGARDIRARPSPTDPAFAPSATERWTDIRRAYEGAAVLYFGPTLGLDRACDRIRDWIAGVAAAR